MLQGTVTGAVGAVAGLGMAAVTLALGRDLFERLLDERIHTYAVQMSDVVMAALIGMAAAAGAGVGPARAVHVRHSLGYLSEVLISSPLVERLALEVTPSAVLFESPSPPTAAQRDELEDIRYDNGGLVASSVSLNLMWDHPRTGPTELQVELLLSAIALVFSLFVVGVSLALAAAESKDERDVLTIAGAPPVALARSAGARAWLMAVIGGAISIPVGFLPVVVFSAASADSFLGEAFPLVFPTRTALLLVLAVPAIVAAASVATSAAAQRLRPVRVSTATFE